MPEYTRSKRRREADRLDVPSDWDGESYVVALACVPDSPLWKAYYRGTVTKLGKAWSYNRLTGDIIDAAKLGAEIEGSLCYMKCDDLLAKLDDIVLAIQGQAIPDLSVVVDAITGLETALQASISGTSGSLTASIDNASMNLGDGLASIQVEVGNASDRVDDLGTDTTTLMNELSSKLLNLATVNQVGLDSIASEVVNVDEVLERTLTYEGVKTDFYGQTMTTQADILKSIKSVLTAIDFNPTVICQRGPNDVSLPAVPQEASTEKVLNAYTLFKLIEQGLNALAGQLPSWLQVPFWTRDYVYLNLYGVGIIYLNRSPLVVADGFQTVVEEWANLNISWTWEEVSAEWSSLEFEWMCYWVAEDPIGDASSIQAAVNYLNNHTVATDDLKFLLSTLNYSDNAIWIANEYLGFDQSSAYKEFYLLREQLRDGFDANYWYSTCT